MIPPPSPVTRGQAGGRRRRKKRRRGRGSGCAGARLGCAEGAASADTNSTSAPMQLGEGKGQPRQQGGKKRKLGSNPGSIPTLPPAPPLEPADPLPTAWEDATLPVSLPLPRRREQLAASDMDAEAGEGQAGRCCLLRGVPARLRKLEGILYHRVMS